MSLRGFALFVSLFAITPIAFAQIGSPSQVGQLPSSNVNVDPLHSAARQPGAMDYGAISGSLVGIDGRPIREVTIKLRSADSLNTLATAISSINGSFTFNNVPRGEYEITAYKGIQQVHQRIHCNDGGLNTVTLRMNTEAPRAGSGDTVSVTSLRVPDKARNEFEKAEMAFQKNKMKEAWKRTDKALKILPTYSEALTLRGILKIAKGDRVGGGQDLQASIKNDSNYPLAYFAMGALQNIEGHFAQAQETLQQGLRVQPTSWQGYFELSKAMLGEGNYRSALKYVVRAQGLGSTFPPIHLVKAHALLGLKFYGDAANEFEAFLKLDPRGPRAADARRSLQAARSFAETASE